jgi:ABC-type multidrug transport system fused ATPase/permease subunit
MKIDTERRLEDESYGVRHTNTAAHFFPLGILLARLVYREGGIVPEEFLVEYAVDRVETTSTVWLGLTLGCARCHDHKFDPIGQKEFYEVLANFNNIPERGKAFKYVNSPPFVTAPTADQRAKLAGLDEKLREAREGFSRLEKETFAAQTRWEAALASSARVDWTLRDRLVAHYPLDGDLAGVGTGELISATLEDGQPHFVTGRVGSAASFDGQRYILAGNGPNLGYDDKFTLAAWIHPTAPDGVIVSRATEGDQGEVGWGLHLAGGKVRINLSTRDLDDGVSPSRDVLKRLFSAVSQAEIIGVTGPPGVGKSTLIDRLIEAYRGRGKKIGGILVDPTSPY